ncbi:hypothetical protein BBK82_42610 [Lentzea guizhouensis]|uniref:Glycosyl transferase family 1 domain-containing protein n=1 Tax=Lentzea guizhouensis TaxID=1586287 RepID=A0A1B2HV94_9PSEU|nr:hypothetical protein BBK82_42610 [Lentzea guizhouensis]
MADRVVLVPRWAHDDLPALLRSADLVLCVGGPALAGTLPLEAMACGPAVVTAAESPADTVADGVTGCHVLSQHPPEVALAVRQLLADRTRRQSHGVAGRDRVLACYSWDHVAADALRLYERARMPAVTTPVRHRAAAR